MSAGNVCVVTGSAAGIGAACAIELARRGNSALQKTSTPEDIADVAIWLLTGGPTVTGELILVDGGNRLGAPPNRS